MKKYTDVNSKIVDEWVKSGWEWGVPIDHNTFENAKKGNWDVLLTPNISVPKSWFGEIKHKKILGLASGGGQQMPIFTALGAQCTVLDYSKEQLNNEKIVADRENYQIDLVHADMTKRFPFEDESFDLIFHPVSNCYIEDVSSLWKECFRVLKKGGILLAGFSLGIAYVFNEEETELVYKLPFNPLKDPQIYEDSIKNDWGIQFSHTLDEELGGQLKAGFILQDIFEDTTNVGPLHDHNVPVFVATKSLKPL